MDMETFSTVITPSQLMLSIVISNGIVFVCRLLRNGKLEAPLFRINKNVVHHVSFITSPLDMLCDYMLIIWCIVLVM